MVVVKVTLWAGDWDASWAVRKVGWWVDLLVETMACRWVAWTVYYLDDEWEAWLVVLMVP